MSTLNVVGWVLLVLVVLAPGVAAFAQEAQYIGTRAAVVGFIKLYASVSALIGVVVLARWLVHI